MAEARFGLNQAEPPMRAALPHYVYACLHYQIEKQHIGHGFSGGQIENEFVSMNTDPLHKGFAEK